MTDVKECTSPPKLSNSHKFLLYEDEQLVIYQFGTPLSMYVNLVIMYILLSLGLPLTLGIIIIDNSAENYLLINIFCIVFSLFGSFIFISLAKKQFGIARDIHRPRAKKIGRWISLLTYEQVTTNAAFLTFQLNQQEVVIPLNENIRKKYGRISTKRVYCTANQQNIGV